jgi:superfamily I DNA/RNA helicase
MEAGANENGDLARERADALAAIVDSPAEKKLVVAGPGTGKTYTFRLALEAADGRGLALTFINNLMKDLERSLGDITDVFTFHGFCKRQMHLNSAEGLIGQLDYFPLFLAIVVDDLRLLGRPGVRRQEVDRALHDLDDGDGLISETIRLGNYYEAVSHTDVVYRMLRFFEERPDRIPEYPLIVVDEYQDFSLLETEFITGLATRSPVLIAGDDDQALYAFKKASPRFIRDLAARDEYERFDLPFCSRCTEVVVAAVNDVVAKAEANGNLVGRIAKQFRCYLPDKKADSDAHPRIIHARCSVEKNKSPYIGRYVTHQIGQILEHDIRESRDKGYPTVLVIGPPQFIERVHAVVQATYPQAVLKMSEPQMIDLLDGYRRLAEDERSRLGWRIVIFKEPFENADEVVPDVLGDEMELADVLPHDYRKEHLAIVRLIRLLLDGQELDGDDQAHLTAAVGKSLAEIKAALQIPEDEAGEKEVVGEAAAKEGVPLDEPTIICTTLVGAKGLSGGYVYVVGCNDGHFPYKRNAITDEEVCCFLVALSRTRKECQLVSCKMFGKEKHSPSRFINWIGAHVDQISVDAAWFKAN